MDAATSPLWSDDDPLFDLNATNPAVCLVPSHDDGPCPVGGLEAIVEELEELAMAASARRDARLGRGEYDWKVIAEDHGVRVVIPA